MVIFGASGDLTKRKLLPALYNLRKAGLLSDHFAVVGAARSRHDRRRVQASGEGGPARLRRRPQRSGGGRLAGAAPSLPDARRLEPCGLRRARGTDRCRGQGPRHRRECPLLPCDRPESLCRHRPAARRRRPDGGGGRPLAPRRGREAVRTRSRIRPRAQPRPAGCARRDGSSIASTTTSARRPSRTSWRSASATASSSRSGTAATSITCRSPPPKRSASKAAGGYYDGSGALRDMVPNHLFQLITLVVDGAADLVRLECGARRAVEGAARDPAIRRRRRAAAHRARPVRTGHREGREAARVPQRGQGASRLQHRDVRRAGAVHRQLALGRRPVLPPHGEDAAEARDGGDDPVQARRRSCCFATRRSRRSRPTSW